MTQARCGTTLTSSGCRFGVYAPAATQVMLHLFDNQHQRQKIIELIKDAQGYWSTDVEGIQSGQVYAYQADGEFDLHTGKLFNAKKLLIDPYAKLLTDTVNYSDALNTFVMANEIGAESSLSNQQEIPKSVIVEDTFDWQQVEKVSIAPEKRVIYEAHVKGLTQLNKKVDSALRGKYLGACHPSMIAHFKRLGITTIQLMPCFSFMTETHLVKKGLTNYWGYNPVNFFAPDWRYAIDDPVTEFKTMVRTFHQEGLEVIMDVVYNHTAEGEIDGPYLSFKGLANNDYYRYDSAQKNYLNFSGCGNTIQTHHQHTREMIIASLRYWVEQMQVDGFRFDLATIIGREGHGFNADAEIFKQIKKDPVLANVLLIAEPWDLNGYALGEFPDPWLQCNDRFRDDLRMLLRGDQCALKKFSTRLMGSQDLFHNKALNSVNYVTYHDGFTLHDLVTYEHRKNDNNKENNRDGHGNNLSANYGVEGETEDTNIIQMRQRQKRNFISLLFLSAGTPHWCGGDELNRTQQGNNNAYCQDNAVSWYDWSDTDDSLIRWVKQLILLRSFFPCFHGLNSNVLQADNTYLVHWYSADGTEMTIGDWESNQLDYVLVEYKSVQQLHPNVVLIINVGDACESYLPVNNQACSYQVLFDTSDEASFDKNQSLLKAGKVSVTEKSICLLQCVD